MPVNKTIQVRRDTAANWTSANPTLSLGEAGLETNTGKLKYGDGTTAWVSLAYFSPQTTITGNAGTATKLQTARLINGVSFDGSANITVADSTKVPTTRTVNGNALSADVTLTNTDVGAAATSHTHVATTDLTATGTKSSSTYLRGDNTWQTPPNTTYTAMSVAEGQAGTVTTSRAMRADYNKQIIQYHVQQALQTMNADVSYGWL